MDHGIQHIKLDGICGGETSCGFDEDLQYEFMCGKMLANPNFNATNFDTIFYSFLMV